MAELPEGGSTLKKLKLKLKKEVLYTFTNPEFRKVVGGDSNFDTCANVSCWTCDTCYNGCVILLTAAKTICTY
jgi:hypothetical protein